MASSGGAAPERCNAAVDFLCWMISKHPKASLNCTVDWAVLELYKIWGTATVL